MIPPGLMDLFFQHTAIDGQAFLRMWDISFFDFGLQRPEPNWLQLSLAQSGLHLVAEEALAHSSLTTFIPKLNMTPAICQAALQRLPASLFSLYSHSGFLYGQVRYARVARSVLVYIKPLAWPSKR